MTNPDSLQQRDSDAHGLAGSTFRVTCSATMSFSPGDGIRAGRSPMAAPGAGNGTPAKLEGNSSDGDFVRLRGGEDISVLRSQNCPPTEVAGSLVRPSRVAHRQFYHSVSQSVRGEADPHRPSARADLESISLRSIGMLD